ncbi:MAG: hypothetical protein JSW07_13530 [bacterium]|nr:MAG: hypothetical protein JSW07_13530 [bacterium]
MYLVAAARLSDITIIQKNIPLLWRQIRRYNLPVQLALAAAEEIASEADDISTAAIISLAPCQAGSPELFNWGDAIVSSLNNGFVGNLRMNPIHTLHAVDNLALSAFAIQHDNHAYGLGLGGSAGQAWCGLETIYEYFQRNNLNEALLMAGDQDMVKNSCTALGIAMLFSYHCRPYQLLKRPVKIINIKRDRLRYFVSPIPHAADGLSQLLTAIHQHKKRKFLYTVPEKHGNGIEQITIIGELL